MSGKNGFEVLKIEKIVPSKDNPRKEFEKDGIVSLANSIKECGLLEPIIVRKVKDGKFEIIAGERRFRAMKSLGELDISARVMEMSDEEAAAARLVENLQRADLPFMEEAEEYEKLLKAKWTVDMIAQKIGKPAYYVYTRTKLLKLRPDIRKEIGSCGGITITHAAEIARIPDSEDQRGCMQNFNASWSVAKLREYIEKKYLLNLSGAPFKTEAVYGKFPICSACKTRTGAQAQMFGESKNDVCLNQACWQKKKEARMEEKLAEYEKAGVKVYKEESLRKAGTYNNLKNLDAHCYDTRDNLTFKEIVKQSEGIQLIPIITAEGEIEEKVDPDQVKAKMPKKLMGSGGSERQKPAHVGPEAHYKRRLELARERAAQITAGRVLEAISQKADKLMEKKQFRIELAKLIYSFLGQDSRKVFAAMKGMEKPAKHTGGWQQGFWQYAPVEKWIKENLEKNPLGFIVGVVLSTQTTDHLRNLTKETNPFIELANIDVPAIKSAAFEELKAKIPKPAPKEKEATSKK